VSAKTESAKMCGWIQLVGNGFVYG